jgi:hypothetical protein
MTPQEKAQELKDKFQKQIFFHLTDERLDINEAKGLALIAVDEIYKELTQLISPSIDGFRHQYWKEVRNEIENL